MDHTRLQARSRRDVFAKPGFPAVYAVGMVWSLCRWAIGFLGAYVVADATSSARLVQLTGALLWAPLLLTGVVGGAISDRISRRNLLFAQFGILGPLTAGIGLLALTDNLTLWVLYLYMVVAGFGWVIDMTARRTMIHDLVGDEHIDDAMAWEGLASAFGLIAGTVAGGVLIGTTGAGGAYLAVAGAIALAALLLLAVPPTPRRVLEVDQSSTLRSDISASVNLVGQQPTLASILGVTALVNFFHFSYFPIVQVIAQRVDASPFRTGLLAAATGAGMAVGATIILQTNIRRGSSYVIGALFASTQGALVMTAVDPAMKGRAMGLLSMAIGVLPLGMTALGELSEVLGAPTALIIFNITGLICILAFLRTRPQAFHIS
jgi:MFS family permease